MIDFASRRDVPRLAVSEGMGRRAVLKAIAAAAAASGLGGVSLGTAFAQDGARRGGVLRVSASVNPSSLDPATGRSGFDHMFLYTMHDSLFEWDYASLAVKPGLAKAWRYPDPKTLVIDLEEGVTFHDGTRCDAEAVKFNLDRARGDQRSNVKADLASVEAVEVTGPSQVTLRLKQPDSALLLILSDRAGMMVSPKAARELGPELDRKPVGSGPWKFVSFTDNDKVVVTRNESYWRKDRPYLDGIEFAIITEVSTGLRTVMAGQNHFVNALPPQQKAVLDRSKKLTALSSPTQFVNIIYLNYGRPPFDDLRVRQAINYAIDRQAFVNLTDAGFGEASASLLPKQHWAYDETAAKAFPYDPERARKLLADAGHPNGLDVHFMAWNDQRSVQRQEVLIEQCRKAGIRLRFSSHSVADSTALYMGPEKQGDGYLSQWTGRPDPSLTLRLIFGKDSYFNAGKADPAPGRVEAQAESEASTDVAQRKQALAKLQRIINDNALIVSISINYDLTGHTPEVKGYSPNLIGKPKFEHAYLGA